MKKKFLIALVIFFPAALLQLYAVPMITIEYIRPDLILIILVSIALKYGQIQGTILGFLYGFIFDFISGGVLGSAMFSKTLVGFIAGYFHDENEVVNFKSPLSLSLIVLLCSFVDSFFFSALGTTEVVGFLKLLIQQSLLSGIYTALISVPLIIFKPFKVFT